MVDTVVEEKPAFKGFEDIYQDTLAREESPDLDPQKPQEDEQPAFFDDIYQSTVKRERDKTIADNLENRSEISRRFRSGIDETQGMLHGAVGIAGDIVGSDTVRDWGYEGYLSNKEEAELNPGTVTRVEDIQSAGDAFTWVTGTIGNLAPTMAEMAVATMIGGAAGSGVPGAGNVVGAVAGAANRGLIKKFINSRIKKALASKAMQKIAKDQGKAAAERTAARIVARNIGATAGLTAGSGALEGGGMYTEHADKVGIENANPYSAAGLGLISGATESLTPGGRVIKRALGMAVQPIERMTKSAARKVLKKAGTKEFLKAVGKQIPKSMLQEGAQELTQGIISTLNAFINDPNEDMLSTENISGYLNSAAGGAVAGLFFGGVEGGFKYGGDKQAAQEKDLENYPLENYQQNQKKIYDLEQNNARTPEEDSELADLKQESDWIKTTPEFKENRTERVEELKTDIASLEKARKLSEADHKTMKLYKQELGDLLDLSVNNRQFESDPMNTANNEDFLEKFIAQEGVKPALRPEVGADAAEWNEYGEFTGPILKQQQARDSKAKTAKQVEDARVREGKPKTPAEKNQKLIDDYNSLSNREVYVPETNEAGQTEANKDEVYWSNQKDIIKTQQEAQKVKNKLVALEAKANPTNKEIQKIAVLEQDLVAHNKKLIAAAPPTTEKVDLVSAKAQENQATIERDEHVVKLEATADKLGLKGAERVTYVADKLKGYDTNVAEKQKAKVEAIAAADTSPKDMKAALEGVEVDPSENQKKSGNYKKAHVKVNGFDIAIENPKGSNRKGTDKSGKSWAQKMKSHYGYFKRSLGKDGDQVDALLNPNDKRSENIFVVDQVDPGTGKFDEHKVMMGYDTAEAAERAYLSNYEAGWGGLGQISEVGRDEFKSWLGDGTRTSRPFSTKAMPGKKKAPVKKAPREKIDVPDVQVKVKYQHEKTGATVTTTVNAREAMAELDTQESIIDKIINCMG